MENIPSEIFDLIETKPFEVLTEKERQLVLIHFSESEYDNQRSVILDFKSVDSELNFESRPIANTCKKGSLLQRILIHPVPLYQIAAGLALFVMVTYTMSDDSRPEVTSLAQEIQGRSVSDGYYPDSLVFNL